MQPLSFPMATGWGCHGDVVRQVPGHDLGPLLAHTRRQQAKHDGTKQVDDGRDVEHYLPLPRVTLATENMDTLISFNVFPWSTDFCEYCMPAGLNKDRLK